MASNKSSNEVRITEPSPLAPAHGSESNHVVAIAWRKTQLHFGGWAFTFLKGVNDSIRFFKMRFEILNLKITIFKLRFNVLKLRFKFFYKSLKINYLSFKVRRAHKEINRLCEEQ